MPTCKECGESLQRPAKPSGRPKEFCGTACARKFHNRRAMRGAELYDFVMASRYQRKKYAGAITIVSQLCREWHDEDKEDRDGRPSWNDIGKSDR